MRLTLNTDIVQGEGVLKNIKTYIDKCRLRKCAFICDKNLLENSSYVTGIVEDAIPSKKHLILYDCAFEPSYEYLDSLMDGVRGSGIDSDIDGIVGIGGGSTLDTAKGIAVLCRNRGRSIEYKGFPEGLNSPTPIIAIPSTTGTGSEVIYNASFIDEASNVKMGINYNKNYPTLAILDPLVVADAPRSVLASSGCDALVHALESFVSTENNLYTRIFSSLAFKLIMENMPKLLIGEGDLINWANMQWAAVFSMFALSNTTSGPTGALSYYLGTRFCVPHGVAGAVFIGKVSRHNHENGYHDYADLFDQVEKIDLALSNEEKSNRIVCKLENLIKLAGVPAGLIQLGVKEQDHDGFVEFFRQAQAAFLFNPVPINEKQLLNMLN